MEEEIDRIKNILSSKVIAQADSKNVTRMILAQRPLQLSSEVAVKRRPAPSLKVRNNNGADLFLAKYHEEGMHAIRYPYLCYVVEGKIDMRLGIPAKRGKARGMINRYEILTLPARTALLIPPGVLYPDGAQNYWEQPSPAPESVLLWVHVLDSGVFCHSSKVQKGKHGSGKVSYFVPGQYFAFLAGLLREEMVLPNNKENLGQATLNLFFSHILRGLKKGARSVNSFETTIAENLPESNSANSVVISRACDYINTNKNIAFTVEDVASHAYVSPSHLMHLFRHEMNMTVMEYAHKQRMSLAEAWLINSDLPVNYIASELSYRQTPQFNRAFKKTHGLSPTAFRRNHQR